MEHFVKTLSRAESDAFVDRIEAVFEKHGFGLWAVEVVDVAHVPEVDWLRAERDNVLAIFDSDQFRSRPYFNADAVIEAFRWFLDGKSSDSLLFWRFLNLELWLRVFFDGNPHERFGACAAQRG